MDGVALSGHYAVCPLRMADAEALSGTKNHRLNRLEGYHGGVEFPFPSSIFSVPFPFLQPWQDSGFLGALYVCGPAK